MKLLRALLPLGLLLLPLCVRAVDPFEGTVTMSIADSSSKKAPQTMTYSVKGSLLRMDMKTDRNTVEVLIDTKARTMTMLMPQQKMYMENPFPEAAAAAQAKAATANVEIKDTGLKETILGYSCQQYVITTEHGTTEMWLAPGLTGFANMYAGQRPGSNVQIPEALMTMIKNGGGFPMKVVTNLSKGSTITMQVTAINPMKLSDSTFLPPPDYKKFDMQGMINAARGGAGN